MNIVVEIGNTNTKFALFDIDKLIGLYRYENDNVCLSDITQYQFENAILAGSGTIENFNWSEIVAEKKIVFDLSHIHDLDILYEPPNTLGQDRVINAYFAAKQYPNLPNLIIDLGTCLTFTFINERKELIGGSISPGLSMRAKSLHDYTAKLPFIHPEESIETNLIGKNTTHSIKSGVELGILYEIIGRIDAYLTKFPNLNIIMTGGDALLFENKINYKIFADPHFTLKGLNDILNQS